MSSQNHITRTFRIEDEIDSVLRDDAEKKGISVNNLVNRILKEYTLSQRFFVSGQSIILSSQTLFQLLSNMDEKDICQAGKQSGYLRTKEQLLLRGMELDRKSAIWYVTEIIGNYSAWYTCDVHEYKDHTMLFLRHTYNESWSQFLVNYLYTMFKELIQLDSEIDYTSTSVIIKIPK